MTDLMRRQEATLDLEGLLQRWVDAETITLEQAAQIRAKEQTRPPASPARSDGSPLVVEALGYLGGVLVVIASALLTVRLWEQLSLALRLALPALAALLLIVGGLVAARRGGDAAGQLRAVLWALSVAAFAAFVALLVREGLRGESTEDVVTITGAAAAAYAGALWWAGRGPLQQLALLVALAVTSISAAAHLEAEAMQGMALWGLGLVWLGLARAGRLPPQRMAYVLGSVAALFGAQITMESGWGNVLALLTAVALVALAVVLRDLGLLALAAVGTLLILPRVVTYFFPGAVAAPLALLVCGVLLVGIAVETAHRQQGPSPLSPGRRRL